MIILVVTPLQNLQYKELKVFLTSPVLLDRIDISPKTFGSWGLEEYFWRHFPELSRHAAPPPQTYFLDTIVCSDGFYQQQIITKDDK